jgi:ribosomal protein S18 acetylase RimI-like enzyme
VSISSPTPLTNEHDVSTFDCGVPELSGWLKKRALQNQFSNSTRTYVANQGASRVIGFQTLAAGAVERGLAVAALRRNSPESIPIILLARLAIDVTCQGSGIGGALLLDAVRRSISASEIIGARALVTNAISESAVRFYQRYGFRPSPIAAHLLMATIGDLRTTFG